MNQLLKVVKLQVSEYTLFAQFSPLASSLFDPSWEKKMNVKKSQGKYGFHKTHKIYKRNCTVIFP